MSDKRIGVLDCNNFFVSCERLFRPDLIGKPVVVLSSNDGCVVARSQEIKDMGIPMGVPYFQIKDTLKNTEYTTFSSQFPLYRDISRRVFATMGEVVGGVEQYSIDEAFFVVDKNPERQIIDLKKRVEQQVGIPVSIGVASTKTLAKYASKQAKKQKGIYVLSEEDWSNQSREVALSQLWGVGAASELQYKKQGLITAADLIEADPARITALFGKYGLALQQELSGTQVHRVGARRAAKQSIISSRSFEIATTDKAVLADALAYHLRHAAAELRTLNLQAGVLRVSILPSRHGDFVLRGGTAERILEISTSNTKVLLKIVTELLLELYEAGVPYKKAGVTLAQFTPSNSQQTSLFEQSETNEEAVFMDTLDTINADSAQEKILLGSRLRTDKWQAQSANRSPAYTTRWSEIASVRAI